MKATAQIFDIRHQIADSQAQDCRDLLRHVSEVEALIAGFEVWASALTKKDRIAADPEMSAALTRAVGLLTAGRLATKAAGDEIEAASHRPFFQMFPGEPVEFVELVDFPEFEGFSQ